MTSRTTRRLRPRPQRVLGAALLLATVAGCPAPRPAVFPGTPEPGGPPGACEGLELRTQVRGWIVGRGSDPVRGAQVGTWDPEAGRWIPRVISRVDGTYELDLQGPAWVALGPWAGDPPWVCAALPTELAAQVPDRPNAVHVLPPAPFRVARTCPFDLITPELEGWSRIHVLEDGVTRSLEVEVTEGHVQAELPCTAEGVVVIGEQGLFAAADGSPEPLQGRAPRVELTRHPVTALRLDHPRPAVLRVHHALGWQPVPASGLVIVPDQGAVEIRQEGHRPALVELPGGRAVHASVTPGELAWTVVPALPPAHEVTVRCEGLDHGTCPATPTCEGPGEAAPTPCAARGDTRTCACPVGPATVRLGPFEAQVAPDAAEVVLDLAEAGAHVRGKALWRCELRATRLPAWWEGLWPSSGLDRLVARCGEGGRVDLGPLSPGTWVVDVRTPDGQAQRRLEIGTDDVDLGDLVTLSARP
ncbi:MAG: hypothetical protein H6732_09195 [Alphaproteobacteria bacterium]|nr:hypothetical protein [Alphaproteobacteria bacterium]